ncbi:hypothetical protein ACFZBU_06425 [Embleya sp. NPDC008237]
MSPRRCWEESGVHWLRWRAPSAKGHSVTLRALLAAPDDEIAAHSTPHAY